MVVLVATLSLHEVYAMAMPERRLERILALTVGMASLICAALWRVNAVDSMTPWLASTAALLWAPPCIILLRPKPLEGAAKRLLTLWGGYLYIVGTFSFGMLLVAHPNWLILSCVVVFFGDTGAYFVGRSIGRRKLYPLLSPNKTIEGALGGLVASVGGAAFCKWLLVGELSWTTLLLLGFFGGALAQIGDLSESALKRACGVKDSGSILPGHGGMLDRVDGLLFALPLFALVLVL